MTSFFKNKTILITGATSGIGEQLAKDLAILDANLILVGRNKKKLKNLKNELSTNHISVITIQLDIQNYLDVKDAMSSIKVDILINNAGLALGLEKIDDGVIENWETMIDTNIKGLIYISREIIPYMKTLETAHIVNIGSLAGEISYPRGNIYCATKAAVHSLGYSMNLDLVETNIKVTTISPGTIETNFAKTRFNGNEDLAIELYNQYKPLSPKDISDTIINILNTPIHVNIQFLSIMPTALRNPYVINKTN